MSTVLNDLVDGAGARQTKEGITLLRSAIVTGVTGDGHSRVLNALEDSGMPSIGDGHPARSKCKLGDIVATASAPSIVEFRLTYRDEPDTDSATDYTWTMDASSVMEESTKGLNVITDTWEDIELEHTFPDPYELNPAKAGKTIPQGGTVMRGVYVHTVRLTKTVASTSATNPVGIANTTNLTTWNGGAKGTWLCSNVSGSGKSDDTEVAITFTFVYRHDGWKQTARYIIPDDGKPASPATATNQKIITVFGQENFHAHFNI